MISVCIIGGGPSGIMAGIMAARSGCSVEIWEKNDKPGKKILVSGNGRCNISNRKADAEYYYSKNPKALKGAFSRFGPLEAEQWFREAGLELREEENGKLFPLTNQAVSVVDVLNSELEGLRVPVIVKNAARDIKIRDGRFLVSSARHKDALFDRVILALGGKSYPFLGTSGDGYRFASSFGHRIVEPLPGLVALVMKNKIFHKLQGVRTDVEIRHGKKIFPGEMMFTKSGISGPPVLDLSLECAPQISKGEFEMRINFFPGYDQAGLKDYLSVRWERMSNRSLVNSFAGILPSKACRCFLELIEDLDGDKTVSQVSASELNRLAEKMTAWPVMISSTQGFDEAQVTCGGVSLEDVDLRTMESKKIPGLFMTGEMLDVTGMCGGYNLQWAWTSGYLAGTAAAT